MAGIPISDPVHEPKKIFKAKFGRNNGSRDPLIPEVAIRCESFPILHAQIHVFRLAPETKVKIVGKPFILQLYPHRSALMPWVELQYGLKLSCEEIESHGTEKLNFEIEIVDENPAWICDPVSVTEYIRSQHEKRAEEIREIKRLSDEKSDIAWKRNRLVEGLRKTIDQYKTTDQKQKQELERLTGKLEKLTAELTAIRIKLSGHKQSRKGHGPQL